MRKQPAYRSNHQQDICSPPVYIWWGYQRSRAGAGLPFPEKVFTVHA